MLTDDPFTREIKYRTVIRELEKMIQSRLPGFLPKPKPLSQEEVVRIARLLSDCHEQE